MRHSSIPLHEAKHDLLDAIQSAVPPRIGYRATEADYAELRAHVFELAAAYDAHMNRVLSDAKERAPGFPGCDALGPVFTDAIHAPFGLLEQIDTLEAGARADALAMEDAA